jgi:hypothetical protein
MMRHILVLCEFVNGDFQRPFSVRHSSEDLEHWWLGGFLPILYPNSNVISGSVVQPLATTNQSARHMLPYYNEEKMAKDIRMYYILEGQRWYSSML